MRDPERIDKYCAELAEIWHKVPDWRFGQLMINVLSQYMSEYESDAFYIEDEKFFKWMQLLFKEQK